MLIEYKKRFINLSLIPFCGNKDMEEAIVEINAPSNVSNEEIYKAIKDCHEDLNDEYSEVSYFTLREEYFSLSDALMDYVCQKNNWTWDNFECDMDIDL